MKLTPEQLHRLLEQGQAVSISGRWFVAVELETPASEAKLETQDVKPERLRRERQADVDGR